MLVQDSKGREWEVLPTDPAWSIASGLRRRGYEHVALDVDTIRFGHNPISFEARIMALLEQYSKTSDGVQHALGLAFLAACTLYDCSKGAYELGLVKE